MSFTKLRYDTCIYNQKLNNGVSYLEYVLNPSKYVHDDECRIQLGIVGGNTASRIRGNMVDLESNLFGIDRELSKCTSMQYNPNERISGKRLFKTTEYKPVDTQKAHLKDCQMFGYPKVPNAPQLAAWSCR